MSAQDGTAKWLWTGLGAAGGGVLLWVLFAFVMGDGGEQAPAPDHAATATTLHESFEITESGSARGSATATETDGPTDCATGSTPLDLPWADVLGAELTWGDGIPLTAVIEFGGLPEDVWRLALTACPVSPDEPCVDFEVELLEAAFAEGPPTADAPYSVGDPGGWNFASWMGEDRFVAKTWYEGPFGDLASFEARVQAFGACDSLEVKLRPRGE